MQPMLGTFTILHSVIQNTCVLTQLTQRRHPLSGIMQDLVPQHLVFLVAAWQTLALKPTSPTASPLWLVLAPLDSTRATDRAMGRLCSRGIEADGSCGSGLIRPVIGQFSTPREAHITLTLRDYSLTYLTQKTLAKQTRWIFFQTALSCGQLEQTQTLPAAHMCTQVSRNFPLSIPALANLHLRT